jgi:hypothetical protein
MASLSTSTLSAGSHTITAVYGGDGNFNGSTSSGLTQVVNPTSVGGTATASPNPVCYDTSTTITLAGNTGTIQWQSSSDNVTFTDISGATAQTFNTGNIMATKYFRAKVTSGVCPSAFSSVATVTVETTPPSINCPPDVGVQCASAVTPHATDLASFQAQGGSASDNCGSVAVVWVSDVTNAVSCANRFTITRTYRASDPAGNTTTCTQTITVNDTTSPVITCPPDKQLQCGDSTAPANTGTATATDNCGGSPTITFTDAATPANCTGQAGIDRTWKATDECGNSSTCVQHITFVDTTPPSATCPSTVVVQCASQVPLAATDQNGFVAQGGTVSDNCGGAVGLTHMDATNNLSCPNKFTITRTYIFTDTCGNSSTCDQIITVNDTTPPVITCPADKTLQCPADTSTNANGVAVASDNCGTVTITYNDVTTNGCVGLTASSEPGPQPMPAATAVPASKSSR